MIVDSLIVELGLDPAKFNKGQKEALDSFKKLQSSVVEGGKDVEYQSGRTAEAIGGIRSATIGMFGALTGSVGLASFATNAIHAGAAAGRLSRNIDVSVGTITKFQGLAEVFGGSAEGIAQSFIQISDALQGWKIGDVRAVVADYRALGTAGGTIIDVNKGVEQTFLDIAKNLRVLHDRDPASAGYWQRRLGLDPGLYDAMIQKGESFADQLKKIRGLTDEEADAAGKLERRWNSLVNTATKAGQSMVIDLADSKSAFNPLQNGADAKDIKMIASWIDSAFGTNLSGGSAAPSGDDATKKSYRESIAGIESAGSGGYSARGPVTSSGDRAYGRYQVMGNNIGEWSQAALGRKLSAQEFLASPEAQDAIFDHRFGQYVKKFGNPQDAASAWFTGQPLAKGANRHDMLGTSGASYAARFTAGLGGSNSTSTTSIQVTGPITIQAGPNADGSAIAGKFVETLKRQSYAAQANSGQN